MTLVTIPRKNPSVRRATCGQYAGYQAHRKANELVCDDCRAARNAWERDRRAARKQAADRAQLTDDECAELLRAAYVPVPLEERVFETIEAIIADRLLRYT